jgi:hypothetical protein
MMQGSEPGNTDDVYAYAPDSKQEYCVKLENLLYAFLGYVYGSLILYDKILFMI